jgi:hypothetical protein
LTLETGAAFFGAALRGAGFGAAFFALTAGLAFAAVFLAAAVLTDLRATGLAAVARRAFGLEADFVLTTRFALFAAGLTFERDVDRLRPFVRLLLMGGISKGCSPVASSPWNWPAAYHRHASRSTNATICGCFTAENPAAIPTKVQTKKNT